MYSLFSKLQNVYQKIIATSQFKPRKLFLGFTGGTFSYVIIPIELYGLFHFRFQHIFTYIDTDFLIKAVDEDSFKSDRHLHKAAKS